MSEDMSYDDSLSRRDSAGRNAAPIPITLQPLDYNRSEGELVMWAEEFCGVLMESDGEYDCPVMTFGFEARDDAIGFLDRIRVFLVDYRPGM